MSFATVMLRFYLMMAIILIAGYAGAWPLAFLALPIFLSCLLGTEFMFGHHKAEPVQSRKATQHQMQHETVHAQHAA